MAIPPVTPDQIRSSMSEFDSRLRHSAEWVGWQANQSHRYAIHVGDKLYPVKQIISMATGAAVSSFSGGAEANSYLTKRGFEIEAIRIPTESETRIALHELLIERAPDTVNPGDAYKVIADRLKLPLNIRNQTMPNTGENHWENRVRFARRKLVDAGLLDGSEHGVWRLKIRDTPKVWVEKVLVNGRPDREEGEYALGKALWSPQRSRSDADDYAAMRELQPGDFVMHLIDNREIFGVSKVQSYVFTNFRGLPDTPWADMDGYLVRLGGFARCIPALKRETFLGNPQFALELRRIRADNKHLFYDRNLDLNQGSYLTPAPKELVALLNRAYRSQAGHDLP
jgi:Mrr N-terminal domain